jgi:hypothetical protein
MAMRSAMKNDHRHRNRKEGKKSPSNRKNIPKIGNLTLSMIGLSKFQKNPGSPP